LIFGQFGLVGLVLAFSAMLTPVFRAFAIHWHSGAWRLHPAAPMAVIVLMAISDALLNSFFFYPAILAAGALASDDASSFVLLARNRERISASPIVL
jgi:hypothetical protein